jgi:hypothetical protein
MVATGRERAAVYVPHPEPEVWARDAQPEEVPAGARRIAKVAEAHGWRVRTTYARGTTLTARGTPGRVVDDILLRMSRPVGDGYAHAVGCWEDGKFDLSYVGAPGETPRRVGARELRAFVARDAAALGGDA